MRRQEDAFLERYRQAQAPLEQLRDRVPQGVQDTLEAAFSKAFCVILEKGTPAIEKTLRKEELKRRAALWAFDVSQKETRRALREPGKKARSSALRDTAFSGAQGLVLGVLGMGLPALLIAMLGFAAACALVALLANALAQLVRRAAAIKSENDLTI